MAEKNGKNGWLGFAFAPKYSSDPTSSPTWELKYRNVRVENTIAMGAYGIMSNR